MGCRRGRAHSAALTAAKEREEKEGESSAATRYVQAGWGGCHSQLFRPHATEHPQNERRSNSSRSVIKGRDRCLIAEVEPTFFTLSIASPPRGVKGQNSGVSFCVAVPRSVRARKTNDSRTQSAGGRKETEALLGLYR